MALTKPSTTVTWTDNVVPAATQDASQTSNPWTLDATCVAAQIQVQATVSAAAPANVLDIWLEQQDGTNWDTPKHSLWIGELDSDYESATTIKFTVDIPSGAAGVQRLRAQTKEGASLTNAMTVTAIVFEQRSS